MKIERFTTNRSKQVNRFSNLQMVSIAHNSVRAVTDTIQEDTLINFSLNLFSDKLTDCALGPLNAKKTSLIKNAITSN